VEPRLRLPTTLIQGGSLIDKRNLEPGERGIQSQEAFNDVARIASFHRIQLSPGLNDAARFIHSHLAKEGIQCELLSFPAQKGVKWWSQESFQEWKANDAELVLLEDGKRETLCAFSEFKTSLIQRSAATPLDGIKTTMVLIENGEDPKSYEGIDVAGKLVFSRGNVGDIAKVAVDQFGAAGIVVDTMREQPPVRDRFDLPDGRQYLSFWPADAGTHKALGFVVSPRQGEALRRRFAEKKELSVFARVDVEFSDGAWEIPTAIIPGESDEVVVAVAHLCHPEQSANDNASGCGTLMETARTLSNLIATGRLQRPKRSIRFLWVPEMTGSYAFLATHEEELKNTVAAINLDMVGENQELCGSTFTVERPVSALPGFGGDLAAIILGSFD
jgi:aminopeptidase YwaD